MSHAVRKDGSHFIAGLKVVWREVRMPGQSDEGRVAFGLWVIEDPDTVLDLISQEEYEQTDERMPYFAMIWASAESLTVRILAGPSLTGLHVLDLGCGLGICGLAAAARGAQVTGFDWETRAVEIANESAAAQPVLAARCAFIAGDWRTPPPMGPFDLIIGADLLYERRNGPAVAAFLARHLKPGAEAWIADPGRTNAVHFPSVAEGEGLEVLDEEILPPQEHGTDIVLLRLRRPR